MTWASDQSISWPCSVHSMFGKGRGHGVGCCQGLSVFLEAVHQSPSRLAYISGGAVTTRDFIYQSCLLLWWDRVFYPCQKVPESFVWFKTGPDAEGGQHSSDYLRRAVHIRDDHSSLRECVGLLLVCWVGKDEDAVRVSIVCLTCCSSSDLSSAKVQRRSALWYKVWTTATLCARG